MEQTEQSPGFDQILKELEKIVVQMEHGNMELEKVISLFEKGISLTRLGEQKLQEAQSRIDILLKDGTVQSFESPEVR
ncbi:exodeoxyribonuclease VII small subunit [Myxococcota bacterium]|nr:exodeoxyribonuclease VII small subunit [Myxococcota bacterium]MBU1382924.1 exodeoxyribonuclease VII small subunit [Myxococcota bacterium]MBU1496921.1 exodeoxyribonuclease VII small subunit [Myxococcota bacterium]